MNQPTSKSMMSCVPQWHWDVLGVVFEHMFTIHVSIRFGRGAKPGLSVKNSLGFSAISAHMSPCLLLHSCRHKSNASIGHCPFIPLAKEMEFPNCFPEILQQDNNFREINGCVDRYPAFKEYHLECDLYMKCLYYKCLLSLLVFLSFLFFSVPPKDVSYVESNSVETSHVSLSCPGHGFCIGLWELATYQDCFVPPKYFDGTAENFTSEQCISLYRSLANKRRLFWISVCTPSLLASCLQ